MEKRKNLFREDMNIPSNSITAKSSRKKSTIPVYASGSNSIRNNKNMHNDVASKASLGDAETSQADKIFKNSERLVPTLHEGQPGINNFENVFEMAVSVNSDVTALTMKFQKDFVSNETNFDCLTKYCDVSGEYNNLNMDAGNVRDNEMTLRNDTDGTISLKNDLDSKMSNFLREKSDRLNENHNENSKIGSVNSNRTSESKPPTLASCNAEIKFKNLEFKSDSNGLPIISVIPSNDPNAEKVIILNATFTSTDLLAKSLVDTLSPLLSSLLGPTQLFVPEGKENASMESNIKVDPAAMDAQKEDETEIDFLAGLQDDVSVKTDSKLKNDSENINQLDVDALFSSKLSISEGDCESKMDEHRVTRKGGCFQMFMKRRNAN